MTHARRLLVLLSLALAALGLAQAPSLVVQTTHPRTKGRVALSPDQKYLATADDDGAVRIWDADSGLLLRTLDLERGVRQISFDNLDRLIVGGAEKVGFYDVSNGSELGALKTKRPLCTSFDYSGDTLVTGDTAQTVMSWDLQSGAKRKTLATMKDVVRTVKLTPSGKTLAVITQDGVLTFFSMPDGKKEASLSGFSVASALDFSPDGKMLAARSDSGVQIIDTLKRKPLQSLPPTFSQTDSLDFGPDGSIYYRTQDGISRFNPKTGQSMSPLTTASTLDFRVSYNRHIGLVTLMDDSIQLYDLNAGSPLQLVKGMTGAANALASSGKYAATGADDGWLHVWNVNTGRPVGSVLANPGGISGIAFSSDGRRVMSVGADGKLNIWGVPALDEEKSIAVSDFPLRAVAASPKSDEIGLIDFQGHLLVGSASGSFNEVANLGSDGRCLTFTPNGLQIAAASGEGDIVVVPTSGGGAVSYPNAHPQPVTFIGFSKDGKMISGAVDGSVKVWPTGSNKPSATIQLPSSVFSGAMSPNGQIAALGGWVQPVALIDMSTGAQTGSLPDESRSTRAVAFSSDGAKILTGERDGATRIWDASNKSLIARRYAISNRNWVVVDDKGRFDGTDDGLKALHWVQGNKTLPLSAFFEQFDVPNLYASLTGAKIDPSEDPPKPPPTPKIDVTKPLAPPPSVRITTPSSDQTVESEQITIEVTATDEGGGIDEISLYQNGKVVSNEQRGLVELMRSQGKTISKKFNVLLAPGENVFKATASNKDRTEASSPKEIHVTLQAPEAAANLYILAVGINKYTNSAYELTFAQPDAQAFAANLKAQGAGIFKTISVETVYDTQATRANVEAAFARIQAKAKPGDAFVFFYSGHGIVTEPDDGTQGQFYIVTTNVTKMVGSDDLDKLGISAPHLRELCMAVPAQKQLIVFDACYSGGAVAAFQTRGAAEEKAIHQLSRSTGVAVLAAASPAQAATEIKALGHGVFTYAILKGLAGEAAPGSGARKVTIGELFAYLNDIVPELTKQYRGKAQFPNTFLSGQDFPIVITKG